MAKSISNSDPSDKATKVMVVTPKGKRLLMTEKEFEDRQKA